MLRRRISTLVLAFALIGGPALIAPPAAQATTKPVACQVKRWVGTSSYVTQGFCSTAAPGTHWKMSVVCPSGLKISTGLLRQGSTWGSLNCHGRCGQYLRFFFTTP